MTTRQQKRAKRSQLIHQLQRLEIQHQRVSGADFIISSCKGCDICTKIRAIGEELSPSNVDVCTASGLTIDSYFEMRAKGLSDKKIAAHIMVSTNSISSWKKANNIETGRMKLPPLSKEPSRHVTNGVPVDISRESELTIEEYDSYRNNGLSLTQIADLLGFSRHTLFRWRKDNGLTDVENESSIVDEIEKRLSVENYLKMKRAGTFDKEIRDTCGVSKSSFWMWKKKHGLTEKKGDLG